MKIQRYGVDYRNLTSEERNMLQKIVDEEHDNSISMVAENRKLDKSYVKSIAEGQVFTGAQAKNLKLIDEIGNNDHALDIAAKMSGINGSYEVITMNPPESFEDILSNLSSKIGYSIGKGIGSLTQKDTIQNVFYLAKLRVKFKS